MMDDPDDPPDVAPDARSVPPDEAFGLLGNETRIEILRALWEAHEPYEAASGVKFSELFERVDMADSGNFTYHLEKLGEHFVRQTDDGYELTRAGFSVVQTVIAGSVHETPGLDMAEVDARCPLCGSTIAVSYNRDRAVMVIRCTECPGDWNRNWPHGTIFAFDMPPAGLRDRTPGDAFRAMLSWRIHRIETMVTGVCPACAGTVERSLSVCEDHDPGDDAVCSACGNRFQTVVTRVCTVCKEGLRVPVLGEVLFHPAVTAFCYERGIDHRIGTWDAIARAHEYEQTILSTDPLRLRVTIPVGEEELRMTLDEDLSVVDVGE